MKRRSLRECLPMLPCPVWPLAGQSRWGQNMGAGSMLFLLALIWHLPRVGRDPRFCYKSASPRFSAELPPLLVFCLIHVSAQVVREEQRCSLFCHLSSPFDLDC